MGRVVAERQWINEQLAWQIYTIDVRGKILIGPPSAVYPGSTLRSVACYADLAAEPP
jgi:hypothetical protein